MKLKKWALIPLAFLIVAAGLLVVIPSLKYQIYKALPVSARFWISSAASDKFLVGMIFFVEDNDRLMLVRHTYQDRWGLPGGWMEKGESIEEAAQREFHEEFGIQADQAKILRVQAVKSKPVIDIALSLHLAGTPTPDQLEVKQIQFFPLNALPPDIIATHKPYIEEYLRMHQSPSQTP